MSDFRIKIRNALLESYKHKNAKEYCCSICGCTNLPLAFHVIEETFDESTKLPKGFVPMSASRGRIRGSYPICTSCSPPCKKCNLPIENETVMEFANKLKSPSGIGVCNHMHLSVLLSAIIKRLFKMGRFNA
jgi:hypothetical protein